MRSETRDILSDTQQDIMRQITSRASVRLNGYSVEDQYYERITRVEGLVTLEKYDVYVLTSYSRQEAQKERLRRERADITRARLSLRRFYEAKQSLAGNACWQALKGFAGVINSSAKLDPTTVTGDKKLRDVSLLRDAAREGLAGAVACCHRFKFSMDLKNLALDQSSAFSSALLSALSEKNFQLDQVAPSIELTGEINLKRSEDMFGSAVFSAGGKAAFARMGDKDNLVAVEVQGKGLHDMPSKAAVNAASEAGRNLGEELADAMFTAETRLTSGVIRRSKAATRSE
ncbi:MAG: hypothetical protein PHV33_14105 [Elusimicrobiales bacterium]|nr:hypothetical protein [Elusimicrobiales bacterium]